MHTHRGQTKVACNINTDILNTTLLMVFSCLFFSFFFFSSLWLQRILLYPCINNKGSALSAPAQAWLSRYSLCAARVTHTQRETVWRTSQTKVGFAPALWGTPACPSCSVGPWRPLAPHLPSERSLAPVSPREMLLLSSLQQTVSRQIGVLLKGACMNHVLVHLKALCRQTCSLYQQARGCKYFTGCIWALTGHLWCMGLGNSSLQKDQAITSKKAHRILFFFSKMKI